MDTVLEHVDRVPPLAMPAEDAGAEDILSHDAIRLFVTRALAGEPRLTEGFKTTDLRAAKTLLAALRQTK